MRTSLVAALLASIAFLTVAPYGAGAQAETSQKGTPRSAKAIEGKSLASIASTYTAFENPPADYRSVTFWVWNNRITERQIDEQLRDFKSRGIGGVFVHPRPGLITPYLSDEWFDRFAYSIKIAKNLGMKIWIYDENSYPSGFAGGNVPAAMPDALESGLTMTKVDRLTNPLPDGTMLVLKRGDKGFEDITRSAASMTGTGDYRLFKIQKSGTAPWYGGYSYVDIMRKDVTEKFLNVTLDPYKKRFGDEFGKTVLGSFEDEAHIMPAGGSDTVNYTPALFDAFKTKWGYDLRTCLPSLYEETGNWKQVRYDYYAVLLDLFINNWAKPYYDYCEQNHLQFTGHYWEHEWPNPRPGPDTMAMTEFLHQPGVDILMNEYADGPHSQFGNARAIKEIRSTANQLGHERTLSETYGAGGWDLTFFDMKRIADWEYVLGVNVINQHLSYVTIMGARKRDHPQSFSYHEPWWKAYGVLGDYMGRLSVAMSMGKQENRVLVLEPTTSAWLYASPAGNDPRIDALGNDFQAFVNKLEKYQVEYDLGSENILRNRGSVTGKTLKIGLCAYDVVILPPGMDNLNTATLDLLSKFLAGGGKVIAWTQPSFVDGQESGEPGKLATRYTVRWVNAGTGDSPEIILRALKPVIAFENADAISGKLFHHRRVFAGGQLVLLVNTSDSDISKGRFTIPAASLEQWDLFTGTKLPYSFTKNGNLLTVDFNLQPGGSLLLCARPIAGKAFSEPEYTETVLKPANDLSITRESPNVLTLDYCDLTLGGKTERDLYFHDAQIKAFKYHGLDGNPWEGAVQYRTAILDKDHFAADSGFEAAYRFTVAPGVNRSSLRAVVERPELYTVSLNGKPLSRTNDAWWLDTAFGVFDLGATAVEGENTLTLKASPFTIHTEIESVYLLGNFGLESRDKGFAVISASPLKLGGWNAQGMPFYAEGVRYGHTYSIAAQTGDKSRYFVQLGDWKGSFAEVTVNGKPAGIIGFLPPELDVTKFITSGENRIEVIVYGTLKNTLGPHHNNPQLGRAWPGMFQAGAKDGRPAGTEYSTVGYGLMEDFRMLVRK